MSARTDLLQVAEVVAREKGIEPEQVLEAMEQAIQKAGRSKYGHEHEIREVIDSKTGEIQHARRIEVDDPVENERPQINQDPATRDKPTAGQATFVDNTLHAHDYGRITAQT